MTILSASQLYKAFGEKAVLTDISFHVNTGDRIGIVGPNGAGKTTLFRILTGETRADQGTFFVGRETKIGYLRQRDYFRSDRTVREEVDALFSDLKKLEADIVRQNEKIAEQGSQAGPAMWARLDELQTEYKRRGGFTYRSEIAGILKSMAFGEAYYDQKVNTLSGGEGTRLNLCLLLLRKPDVLLLDEPTNHLDIGTLRWLEQYLASYRGTLLVISHDRYFLDRVTNRIFEIENHRLTSYTGNYSAYVKAKETAHEAATKAYLRQEKEIRRQEDMIRRYKERGTEKLAKRASSREKRLSRMDRLDRPEPERGSVRIAFKEKVASGNDALRGENLSVTLSALLSGEKQNGRKDVLFRHVNFDIKRGEKICLVGPNGVGKTTLLRLIKGDIPCREGSLRKGFQVEFGYYDQGLKMLSDEKTVLDELHDAYRLYSEGELRTLLASFLFRGDAVFRLVGDLSGGEKARLSLLKLMLGGANFLLLDEPTNHLDIESKEAFESALIAYPGTAIIISHDRYLLNRIPDRILELSFDGISEYLGKYDYYMEKKAELLSGKAYLRQVIGKDEEKQSSFPDAKEDREAKKKKEADDRRKRRRKEELEKAIAKWEAAIGANEKEMCREAVLADPARLTELAIQNEQIHRKVEEAYDEWADLEEGT